MERVYFLLVFVGDKVDVMTKLLKKISRAILTAIMLFFVIVVLSAVSADALGFSFASSFFAGVAYEAMVLYVIMLPRMNERENWRIGKRMLFFLWLFISMCGLKMMYILF